MCSIFLVSATNVFLLRQFYLSFVKSLKEAAYVDGCGNVRFFLWVLLPASKPIMVTVFLSSFVSVWNQYVWPMLVTNQNEMRTIQVGITMLKDRESAVFGPVRRYHSASADGSAVRALPEEDCQRNDERSGEGVGKIQKTKRYNHY